MQNNGPTANRTVVLLVVVVVTALVTYLAVTNRQLHDRNRQLEEALAASRAASVRPIQQMPQAEERLRRPNVARRPVPALPEPAELEKQGEVTASSTTEAAPNFQTSPSAVEREGIASARAQPVAYPVPVAVSPPSGWTRYDVLPSRNRFVMEGTSTRGAWRIESAAITGQLLVDARFNLNRSTVTPLMASSAEVPILIRATVSVPLASLQSGDQQFSQAFKQALGSSKHPTLDQHLFELQFRGLETNSVRGLIFGSAGELVINGVTNSLRGPLTVQPRGPIQLRITGSFPFKLSDFHIRAPAPEVEGTPAQVEDDVKVSVEWWLERTARIVDAK